MPPRISGDGRRAIALSEQALALLPADDWQSRSVIATNLGIAYWYAGNLNRSEQVLREAQEASRRARQRVCRARCASIPVQDRGCAWQVAERHGGLPAGDRGGRRASIAALAHADLAKLLYDQNDLTAAAAHARQATELGRRSGQPELQIAAAPHVSARRTGPGRTGRRPERRWPRPCGWRGTRLSRPMALISCAGLSHLDRAPGRRSLRGPPAGGGLAARAQRTPA